MGYITFVYNVVGAWCKSHIYSKEDDIVKHLIVSLIPVFHSIPMILDSLISFIISNDIK